MTFQTVMMLLRLIHILAGLFWAGAAVLLAAFLLPAARESGPAGGAVMHQLMDRRKLAFSLMLSAILTILSGLLMYGMIGAGSFGTWISSRMGVALGVGGIAAMIAAGLGRGVLQPAVTALDALGARAAEAPSPELRHQIAIVQRRLGRASVAAAVLLVIATSAMATARYI